MVRDIAVQTAMVRKLRQLRSTSTYKRPNAEGTHQLPVLVFADAARPSSHGQLGIITGLLIGDICVGSIYHALSWSSHLSRRPTKSIGSADVLATGFGIDEGILTSAALSILLSAQIPVTVVADSKDLFDSLTSCHVPEDKSIRADVQLIRYYFETRQIHKMVWVPGSLNLADPLTKKDSSLCDALQILLFDGSLPFSIPDAKERCSEQNLG